MQIYHCIEIFRGACDSINRNFIDFMSSQFIIKGITYGIYDDFVMKNSSFYTYILQHVHKLYGSFERHNVKYIIYTPYIENEELP